MVAMEISKLILSSLVMSKNDVLWGDSNMRMRDCGSLPLKMPLVISYHLLPKLERFIDSQS